jgi:hypothetical protein
LKKFRGDCPGQNETTEGERRRDKRKERKRGGRGAKEREREEGGRHVAGR